MSMNDEEVDCANSKEKSGETNWTSRRMKRKGRRMSNKRKNNITYVETLAESNPSPALKTTPKQNKHNHHGKAGDDRDSAVAVPPLKPQIVMIPWNVLVRSDLH